MPSGLTTTAGQIRNPRSKVYRRIEIKRRNLGTGTYESGWTDVSADVIKWGSIRREVDSTRINQFKFSNITVVFNNDLGKYNPSSDENSFWYNYGSQQRTLVRITAGFLLQEKSINGIWTNTEIPSSVIYSGYISGDINAIGTNQVTIPIVPLTEAFRQFSASRLTFYDTSLTASDFMFGLRDQQDTNGAYIFRPFFGDTTSNWLITTTTVEYANLNTSTAADLTNLTVWDVIQKLAEAENFVPYVTSDGKFKFNSRNTNTTTVFSFFGGQSFSSEYGRTIKRIGWYGQRFTKYYSRVTVKWSPADTSTSYETFDSQYLVSGDSGPWTQGERTLAIDNTWIPTSTVAEAIASSLFTEFSAIKTEIEFTTSFVPHLDVFDSVLLTYDQTPVTNDSLWDVYNWQDTGTANEPSGLFWDDSAGDAIKLQDTEFKLISIDLNLDTCECKFIGRQ